MSTPEPTPAAPAKPFGLVGYVETPAQIYHACEALRDAGYKKFDAHTPFPVHGLENAMGLKPSRLPWVVLACAATGLGGAFLMQWWMSVVDYPLNVGGKTQFTIPNWVPVMFELTILLSAFGSFFGMWIMNGLPKHFHPVMQHPTFGRASDDLFFVAVEATDPNFDPARTRQLLEGLGVKEIAEVAS